MRSLVIPVFLRFSGVRYGESQVLTVVGCNPPHPLQQLSPALCPSSRQLLSRFIFRARHEVVGVPVREIRLVHRVQLRFEPAHLVLCVEQ